MSLNDNREYINLAEEDHPPNHQRCTLNLTEIVKVYLVDSII